MHIVYTKRITGFDNDKTYRNPAYFDKPEKAAKVTIEGNYPKIEEAYKEAKIAVEVINQKMQEEATDLTKLSIDELKKRLADAGITFEDNAKKNDLIKLLQGKT